MTIFDYDIVDYFEIDEIDYDSSIDDLLKSHFPSGLYIDDFFEMITSLSDRKRINPVITCRKGIFRKSEFEISFNFFNPEIKDYRHEIVVFSFNRNRCLKNVSRVLTLATRDELLSYWYSESEELFVDPFTFVREIRGNSRRGTAKGVKRKR